MRFGLYSSIANPPRGEHLDRSIDETIAEAQLAESCGFDSIFFGEHHQDKDGFLPSPLIVAAAVAARTRTLRVGLCLGGIGGKRAWPPGHHRADGRLGRRDACHRLCAH